jgi:hypothetical protein
MRMRTNGWACAPRCGPRGYGAPSWPLAASPTSRATGSSRSWAASPAVVAAGWSLSKRPRASGAKLGMGSERVAGGECGEARG